jgi:hypothetical protein
MTWTTPSFFLIATLAAAGSVSAAEWRPAPLDRPLEIEAALEACPSAVRDGAGVYALVEAGYELARPSRNGFHAIVERSQPAAFEPQCLDAEGSATALQRIVLAGGLQMAGASPEEIAAALGRAWSEGRLKAPRRPGVNYMLSRRNRVPVSAEQVIPYGPHVMFYVPYLTNADVGGDDSGEASPLFVVNGGEPSAYAIVPVILSGGAADSGHEGH